MKKFIAVLLSVAVIGLLAACSGPSSSEGTASQPPPSSAAAPASAVLSEASQAASDTSSSAASSQPGGETTSATLGGISFDYNNTFELDITERDGNQSAKIVFEANKSQMSIGAVPTEIEATSTLTDELISQLLLGSFISSMGTESMREDHETTVGEFDAVGATCVIETADGSKISGAFWAFRVDQTAYIISYQNSIDNPPENDYGDEVAAIIQSVRPA